MQILMICLPHEMYILYVYPEVVLRRTLGITPLCPRDPSIAG